MYFINRKDAGKKLADALAIYKNMPDAIVLALPRGGVPVAYEISKQLHLPLDLMLVRKLGVPENEELAMGAIAMGDIVVLNDDIIRSFCLSSKIIDHAINHEGIELTRRNNAYRDGKQAPDVKGKTVILVDDGMATGANMRAAVQAVKKQEAAQVIVAIPISSHTAFGALDAIADDVVCLGIPEPFYGVGRFYRDFSQTSDDEVKALLKTTYTEGKKINARQRA